jgi:hypothetical protein
MSSSSLKVSGCSLERNSRTANFDRCRGGRRIRVAMITGC